MKINVFIERENKKKTLNLKNGSTTLDLLKSLNINPVTVIVSKNKELITEDQKLRNKDEIKIHSVVSGG